MFISINTLWSSAVLVSLLGCSTPESTEKNTVENIPSLQPTTQEPNTTGTPEIPNSSANPTPSNTNTTDSTDLPDLKQGLSRTGCDNGPGKAGAASYFVGEIKIKDGVAKGYEDWVLFANQNWKQLNGADCIVHWTLQGSTVDTQACGSCNTGVSLTNTLDVTGSTCPEDMAKGETGKKIGYDIKLNDDGTAIVYFSRSGKKIGEGYHKDGTIRYVTDMSCRWF